MKSYHVHAQTQANSVAARLENRPEEAGRESCYRCGARIGDAEYLTTQDGCVRHFACPLEGSVWA